MEATKILALDVSLGYAPLADHRPGESRMAGKMDGPAFAGRREALGLTQSQLAEKFEINRVTVAKWEGNSLPIRKVTVLALERLEDIKKSARKPAQKR